MQRISTFTFLYNSGMFSCRPTYWRRKWPLKKSSPAPSNRVGSRVTSLTSVIINFNWTLTLESYDRSGSISPKNTLRCWKESLLPFFANVQYPGAASILGHPGWLSPLLPQGRFLRSFLALSVCFWVSSLFSLNLCFLICKMGQVIPPSLGNREDSIK